MLFVFVLVMLESWMVSKFHDSRGHWIDAVGTN